MEILGPCQCPLAAVCSRGSGPLREIQRKQHNILYVQGEPASQVYFVRKGTVSLHRMSSENRALGRTRALRHHGTFLGIEALIDDDYQDSARAETPLQLCVASRERARDWISGRAAASLVVLKAVLRTADDELIPQAAPDGTAVQRVASWILDRHQIQQTVNLPRQVIADLLGMRPETLSRALHLLDEEGLIEASRRYILLVDQEGLRRKLTK